MTWNSMALQSGLGDALASQPAVALGLLFGAGVLTSLTPCIYPMIPITAGIVSGTAGDDAPRSRIVGLTATYAAGLALLYAVAGLIAGLSGQLFGTIATSVWARLLTAVLLAVFGLAMLDVIRVAAPRRLAAWAASLEGGSYPAVFVLGATSGLVAAPCGAPAFAAVLTWVSTTGSPGLGFLYLFTFSLGMTALLFIVGISAGAVNRLPSAGPWTGWIKKTAGILLLGTSAYYAYQAWLVW
ncbi:MAG: cytochrome c biogenesis protein CcdA [Candidatus Palauibacterales bacterium]|jgi:cytochrome c-type biogenesis protein|nr:cytochrome c biogenesis protein CcdA [Candidatus Palauibacterales bacterium]